SLPHASIHVYDNNSSDRTAHAAGKAGAVVRRESFNGKANLVRRMFADIDADIYVLADGDSTCDPAVVDKLIGRMVAANVDMVVGARGGATAGGRRGRAAESRLLTRMVSGL